MNRSFSSLNAQEALHVAIFIEERNARIYHEFAELFSEFHDTDSLEVASTFWEMAHEERQHGTLLQKLYFERYGNAACHVTEEDISEFIEVPKFEEITAIATSPNESSLSPRERALEIGLRAEQSALEYYRRLSSACDDPELRSVYRELAQLECTHTEFLQKKVAEGKRHSPSDSGRPA